MRKEILILRLAGVLVLALGIFLWKIGGLKIPIGYGGLESWLPGHILFVLLGAWLLLHPITLLQFISWVLPEQRWKRFHSWVEKLGSHKPARLTREASSIEIAAMVNDFISTYNRRLGILIAVSVFIIIPALALYVDYLNSESTFLRESNNIVRLVQNERIEFASKDRFREKLDEAKGPFKNASENNFSTRRIYNILEYLYGEETATREDFHRKVMEVYDTEFRYSIDQESGLLNLDSINAPQSSSESPLAKATLLTLLAIICTKQGVNGEFPDPYLRAQQLLMAADKDKPNHTLPATHNALGVCKADLLKAYDIYADKFNSNSAVREKMRIAFGSSFPNSSLLLVREAIDAYTKAETQSQTNLAKARALNNKVDVKLAFLYRIHVQKKVNRTIKGNAGNEVNDVNGASDQEYLDDKFAHPDAPNQDPRRLFQILDDLKQDLDIAGQLAREPEINFTRAQLYALGGKFAEAHLDKVKVDSWIKFDEIAEESMGNLERASRELGKERMKKLLGKIECIGSASPAETEPLSKELLAGVEKTRNKFKERYLEWLVERKNLCPRLKKLVDEKANELYRP